MSLASSDTAAAMAKGNAEYEAMMGFRYIVCATGKSAEEMLQILQRAVPLLLPATCPCGCTFGSASATFEHPAPLVLFGGV